jgi:ribosomal protein S18 acetylase RimI-like enzyme
VKITKYKGADQYRLYTYWRKLGENVPYFFPVSPERWTRCLLVDEVAGERMFDRLETYVAEDEGQIIGFAQFGHPYFSWDDRHAKYYNPQIGVLRHFYFSAGRFNAAEAMYAYAQSFLMHYPRRYAFYHIYGMSCNAHHGKLYTGMAHVDRFIKAKGFQIEHENVNYSLNLNQVTHTTSDIIKLIPQAREFYAPQIYKIMHHNTPVGTITVQLMDIINGEADKDVAYLSLLQMDETYRGRGWGTLAMQLLYGMLRDKGYRHLHLDTASTNLGAQRFYTEVGFRNRGSSRSYRQYTRGI